jgi:hypothetical protein
MDVDRIKTKPIDNSVQAIITVPANRFTGARIALRILTHGKPRRTPIQGG